MLKHKYLTCRTLDFGEQHSDLWLYVAIVCVVCYLRSPISFRLTLFTTSLLFPIASLLF